MNFAIWRGALQALPVALVLSAITGCTAGGFVVTGELVDGETGKPMPNAWLHQEWILDPRFEISLGWARSGPQSCQAEQVTKTDKDGKFRFTAPPSLKNHNPLRLREEAYVKPLVPGFELDYDKSMGRGASHQVVVAKKIARSTPSETRATLASQAVGLLRAWQRCDSGPAVLTSPVGVLLRPGDPIPPEPPPQAPQFAPPDDVRVAEAAKGFYTLGLTLAELQAAVERGARIEGPISRERELKRELRNSAAFNYYRNFLEKQPSQK